jgi:hypothetical protein
MSRSDQPRGIHPEVRGVVSGCRTIVSPVKTPVFASRMKRTEASDKEQMDDFEFDDEIRRQRLVARQRR